MRYHKELLLRISEDVITNPKLIRFKEELTFDDDALIVDLDPHIETFSTGIFTIDISSFATVNWFYVKADAVDISIKFNGNSTGITFTKDKASELWGVLTAIEITTTATTRITYVVGGV